MEGPKTWLDLPVVKGCVGRAWDEHTCGVHHGPLADDRGVCGNPPGSHQMQAGQAKEGGSTTPLVVGTTDGLGRQRCNWNRRVMVRSKSHSAVRQRGKQRNNWAICKGAALPPPCSSFAATLMFCYSFSVWRVPLLGTWRQHTVCALV
jgi:hypothetical protein